MDPNVQRRVQRYGWDRAADDYEALWQAQLAPAQATMLQMAAIAPGERVLDVACGTGLVTFAAARAAAPSGQALGVDISGEMIRAAASRAADRAAANVSFARMDAEALELSAGVFDVALCGLGLMYAPQPEQALAEMRRVLRPGGRIALAVWGERAACAWAPVFGIVDAEVASEVCPLFFGLGTGQALAELCAAAGFEAVEHRRIEAPLAYATAELASDAVLVGGPVALAWSRFDAATRARVRARYLEAIAAWRVGEGYQLPGQFVIVAARVPE
jgi:ubiquinone/menaquinone biosynthesis C-methylase UbiE